MGSPERLSIERISYRGNPAPGVNMATVGRAMDMLNLLSTAGVEGARVRGFVLNDGQQLTFAKDDVTRELIAGLRALVCSILAGLVLDHPSNSMSESNIPDFRDMYAILAFVGQLTDSERLPKDVQLYDVVEEFWRKVEVLDPQLVRVLHEGANVSTTDLFGLVLADTIPARAEDTSRTTSILIEPHTQQPIDEEDVPSFTATGALEAVPEYGSVTWPHDVPQGAGLPVLADADASSDHAGTMAALGCGTLGSGAMYAIPDEGPDSWPLADDEGSGASLSVEFLPRETSGSRRA